MSNAPIGIFDSGVGGLTVARSILDQLPNESTIYIGDTAHDAEAASAMGVDCVLAAHGHQDRKRLEGLGVRVVDGFAELLAEL